MKLYRHGCTLAVALLLSAMAPKLYAQGMRIAVVDLQRALNETEDGRRAKTKLKTLFKRRQQALDKQQNAVKALKEEIETKISVWNDETKQRKIQEYQEKLVELQQTYVEYQRELAEAEGRFTREILARMERILRRIGQSDGYTLIVERNEGGVMWVPSNLDLTDQVIQRYNAGEGRDGEGSDAAPREGQPRRPAKRAPTKSE